MDRGEHAYNESVRRDEKERHEETQLLDQAGAHCGSRKTYLLRSCTTLAVSGWLLPAGKRRFNTFICYCVRHQLGLQVVRTEPQQQQ
jgi:hypothetical protein